MKINIVNLHRYTWIGACNATGQTIFEIYDPYLDSERQSVVWIESTPTYCLDYIECQVLDVLTTDEGVSSLLITDIYGKQLNNDCMDI